MFNVFEKLYRAQSTKDGGGTGQNTVRPGPLSKIIHDQRGHILTLAIGAIALTATASAIAVGVWDSLIKLSHLAHFILCVNTFLIKFSVN